MGTCAGHRAGPCSACAVPASLTLGSARPVESGWAGELQGEEWWWQGLRCFLNPFVFPGHAGFGFRAGTSQGALGRAVPAQHSYPAALGVSARAHGGGTASKHQQCPLHGPALLQEQSAASANVLLLRNARVGHSTFSSGKLVFIFPCFTVEFPGDAIGGTWLHSLVSWLCQL